MNLLLSSQPDTANPSSCTRSDTSHSGDAQHPISDLDFWNSGLSAVFSGGAFCPDLWHPLPSMLPRHAKANVDIEASVCVSTALPPSCSLAGSVQCCEHFLSALWRRAKCPQCPIPGLPLSHNATGHLYAHFYIYLLVCCVHDVFPVFFFVFVFVFVFVFYIYLLVCRVHDVFPVFVGVENIEPAMDWNKVQVSVQLKLKSLTKGIEANLK